MKWKKFDLGKTMKEDLIETATNGEYKFQAEIVKKVNLFGEKLFGDFDIRVSVFDINSNFVDKLELKGMNGNFSGAKNQLNKLKKKALTKYVG